MNEFQHKFELECVYCGKRIWSKFSGHYASHVCEQPGKVSREYDHSSRKYVAAYPYIAIDETAHYCRQLGEPKDFKIIKVAT